MTCIFGFICVVLCVLNIKKKYIKRTSRRLHGLRNTGDIGKVGRKELDITK